MKKVKEKYSEVINVIRFKNEAQVPVLAVKLEFSSPKARDTVFQDGAVSGMHMKYKVVEYYIPSETFFLMLMGYLRILRSKPCPMDTFEVKSCGILAHSST